MLMINRITNTSLNHNNQYTKLANNFSNYNNYYLLRSVSPNQSSKWVVNTIPNERLLFPDMMRILVTDFALTLSATRVLGHES